MPIVFDASVAVNFPVQEQGSDAAQAILSNEPNLVAPDLLLTEVANAFWSMVRDGRLLSVQATRHLDEIPDYFDRLYPTGLYLMRALQITLILKHPVYDCAYIGLAEDLGCGLITADRKLYSKAHDRFSFVRLFA